MNKPVKFLDIRRPTFSDMERFSRRVARVLCVTKQAQPRFDEGWLIQRDALK